MKTTFTILLALLFSSSQFVFGQNTPLERFESIDNLEFKEALATGEYILLDIRSVEEYDIGHIEGSKLVEYNGGDMDNTFNYMPKNNKYLIYSSAGDRSKQAMERMKELGFSHVLELNSGLEEWK